MGQSSACCNPTTQLHEPDISLPNDVYLLEPVASPPAEHVEPTEQVLDTIRKGEEYLTHHFQRAVVIEASELSRIEVGRPEGKQVVYCRGGTKGTTLAGPVILYFPNREVFKGIVEANRPTFGVFVFRHGCFYAGQMRGFNAEGDGRFQNADSGYVYEGSWAKSLPHGRGIELYANGDRFEGELMYGAKFGAGTYSFHNGNLYEGSFYYNQSDGRGKLTYANGDIYDGEWKLGQFNGQGKFLWANGERFEGEYVEGRRHGFGKYFFRNGSCYEGRWANGLQEGQGVLRDKFDEIKGVWQQGELIDS